jgi:hypothetical protein
MSVSSPRSPARSHSRKARVPSHGGLLRSPMLSRRNANRSGTAARIWPRAQMAAGRNGWSRPRPLAAPACGRPLRLGRGARPSLRQAARQNSRAARASPGHCCHALARKGDRLRLVARRATRDDSKTRGLLDDRLRLVQVRGETERATALHHRDRRAGHSFHSRSFEA